MRTFTQKPKTTKKAESASSAMPEGANFGQSSEVNSILHSQRQIKNQAENQAENQYIEHNGNSNTIASGGFADAPNNNLEGENPGQFNASQLRKTLGAGLSLSPDLRERAESHLGPLGRVNVHTDKTADRVATRLGAEAFTFGRRIGFAANAWNPESPGGYQLLVHELSHVKQAGDAGEAAKETIPVEPATSASEHSAETAARSGRLSGSIREPAALRLRQAPLFGFDWRIEHSDVGSGNEYNQLLRVYRRLTGADAQAAAVQVRALVDNLANGNTALLLRAYDFLRDNRPLLPSDLLSEIMLRVARFCGTRTDSPASPGDDFYRDLLIAGMYTADPGSMVITHSSGDGYAVPGLQAGQSDFGATGSPTSLQRPVPPSADHPISGGFSSPLSVTVGFGTGARAPASGAAVQLIRSAGTQIDPRLVPAVSLAAEDRYFLRALRSFLIIDHGRLVAMDNELGRYVGEVTPPTIRVGISGGDLDSRATLVHELLHYVFDRSDSAVAESRDLGGADHPAIEAIEARYIIISLIRSGRPPLHDLLEVYFGIFLQCADLYPQMQEAIRTNDRTRLFMIVNQPAFVTTVIGSGLMPVASGSPFLISRSENYRPTEDEYRDLAFIWAQNAVIVSRAMTEAFNISGQLGIPLADVFARDEWRAAMNTLLGSFVNELQSNPRQGVVALEQRI